MPVVGLRDMREIGNVRHAVGSARGDGGRIDAFEAGGDVATAPGEFESCFERIVQRGLTIDQVEQLVEVASQAGMDIVGPPLSDDEVAAILRGEAV